MTDSTAFDWRSFLLKWSGEWADSLPESETRDADDEAARQARRLGFPPAPEARTAAMEERLGRQMPPSYREFLKVSDGWRNAGGFVWLLAGAEDAHWHNNESGLADMYAEHLDEDSKPEAQREADLWRRSSSTSSPTSPTSSWTPRTWTTTASGPCTPGRVDLEGHPTAAGQRRRRAGGCPEHDRAVDDAVVDRHDDRSRTG